MRIVAAFLCVFIAMVYAWSPGWRSWRPGWFYSTCFAVLFMAFLERPDMPRSIGVPGINLWNLLMINNFAAWLCLRGREGYAWDFPKNIRFWGLLFAAVMFVAFLRILLANNPDASLQGFGAVAAYFINCFKWFLPPIILFDGCRKDTAARNALGAILVTYLLVAIIVVKTMPLSDMGSGEALSEHALKRFKRALGYHRVDVAMMLAGASWAFFCCRELFARVWQRTAMVGMSALTLLGLALTGGRMGYVTFVGIGFVLALVKWRRLLLLGPVCIVLLIAIVPAARERMMMGFAVDAGPIQNENDTQKITSGRVLIWPLAIERIRDKPLFGWGREGFNLSGLREIAWRELKEEWPHPHNAYLEYLLDNGMVGFLLSVPIYSIIIIWSFQLLRKKNGFATAIGGATFSLWLALLLASLGSQTFYTRESTVMMWAMAGIMIRVRLEYHRLEDGKETNFFEESVREPEEEFILEVA